VGWSVWEFCQPGVVLLLVTRRLRTLARRVQTATEEAAELQTEILAHVRALTPQLLDEPGVGPIVAA
jgi:hypothetical protein